MAVDDPEICGGRRGSERGIWEEDGGEIFVRVSIRRRLGAGEGDLTGARAPASCPSLVSFLASALSLPA